MNESGWDRPTRVLHLGLAVTVTVQLLVSLFMTPPGKSESHTALTQAGFVVHKWLGMAALIIVLGHWAWTTGKYGKAGLRHLFPWGRNGRREIAGDIRRLAARNLVDGGQRGGLPGLAHGLGLLAVTAMAITGGVLFVLLPAHGEPSALARNIGDVHSFIANFVWAYWYGHLGMALLHHLKGHDTLRKMFSLG
ncbi:MAG: cytochrome b/b6 domain-containing protein [Acidiferrobacterales bacterium]